jgi:hypothetical protein
MPIVFAPLRTHIVGRLGKKISGLAAGGCVELFGALLHAAAASNAELFVLDSF